MSVTQEQAERMPVINPGWRTNGWNMWGQTEEEFWAMVEDLYPSPTKGEAEC